MRPGPPCRAVRRHLLQRLPLTLAARRAAGSPRRPPPRAPPARSAVCLQRARLWPGQGGLDGRSHRHDALALRAVKDSTVFGAFVVVLLLPLAVRIFPKSTGAFGGFILAGGAIFFVLCSVQTTLVLEIYLWKKHYRGESARSKAASAARWVVAIIMGLLPALMF